MRSSLAKPLDLNDTERCCGWPCPASHLRGACSGPASDFASQYKKTVNQYLQINSREKKRTVNYILNIYIQSVLPIQRLPREALSIQEYIVYAIRCFHEPFLKKLLKAELNQTKDNWGSHGKRIWILNIFSSRAEPKITVGFRVEENKSALITNQHWKRKGERRWSGDFFTLKDAI